MLTALLARRCGCRVVAPNYRLAPEHPFPAALDDALAVYRHLLGSGQEPGKIAVSGDSAGGGLAVALMMALVEAGDPLPAAAVLMSPWVDLTLSSKTCSANAGIDAVLNVPTLGAWAAGYSGVLGLEHPLVSPLFGNFGGLPPMLIQVGGDEVLLDDARRLAARAAEAGVAVELRVWEGLWHCWQVLGTLVPENKASMAQVAAFLESHFR
jgi:acetyl esterase/lipase